ncbi:hypothetical protein [Sulfobacillus sp. hq2]|uniref:hypothetical protein n=1 Tax=Sulfobacillus TaxID=28033 RepID=UPI000CD2AA7D|nr:hypothetical protein [Sulfobacillus sp. hq2]POB11434.1 hypothetical protein CO251_04635 [Sulfobacillus sp. hq2]
MKNNTLKEKFDRLEKELEGESMHPMVDAVLKNVVIPQLKSVPDAEAHKVKAVVRRIVKTLQDVFEV